MMRIELKKLDSLVVSFMFLRLKIHSNDAIYLFGGFSINKPPLASVFVCSMQYAVCTVQACTFVHHMCAYGCGTKALCALCNRHSMT